MARPKHDHPTPGELEVLKVLWTRGPSSGRDVMDALNQNGQGRAYTSVTSLLNVMADKKLVRREQRGRAFVYSARVKEDPTRQGMLRDLMRRAFGGSAHALVASLLNDSQLSEDELAEIRQVLREQTD